MRHLDAVGRRLAAAVRRLHDCERYRLLLFEGGIDPTRWNEVDESRAAAQALLDLHDGLRPIISLESDEAARLQPWLETLRQGLEPILDLRPSPEKGVHP